MYDLSLCYQIDASTKDIVQCSNRNIDMSLCKDMCGTVLRESTVLREKMDAIIEAQEIH